MLVKAGLVPIELSDKRDRCVVHEIFEQHRGDLRMVSATAQLCQEEAMAYLLADLLDYELLPKEAFAIGEEMRDAHRDFKGKPRKGKPPPKLPAAAYEDLPASSLDFGEHELGSLELCSMQGLGADGYYPVLASVSLDGRS